MKTATIQFNGISPISFSRFHNTPALNKEAKEDYENRTWIEKVHYNENNEAVITPFMIKNMLSDTAKFLGMQIKGKGKSTYTKHFEAGVIVNDQMPIGIKKDDIKSITLFVPSDGKRGGGTRVPKNFPYINNWQGTSTIYIIDETITKDVLQEHLDQGGMFIGMGSLRPRNNGTFGRFKAEIISFE
jgi:hypothetical protein